MGAYVHKKYGGVEIAGDMLLGDHGLLDGIGAADRGTVAAIAAVNIPGADTLKKGDGLGLLAVGRTLQVALSRARGRQ